ncbi:hypothetical protein JKF63_03502 [Porcisia hertigi]|uniref:Uncharacterized protein n=1 Tax=Porcisia hertigi TaxID=2761500 RepID=A0A836HZT4_9TRYP|nr:hypothetical protein JKF63_03502 [Porcisia hertigi]
MISERGQHHACCAGLFWCRGEVVHFSSDAQAGLVRLVTRLCGDAGAAFRASDLTTARTAEVRLRRRAVQSAPCVPFSSKQVFVTPPSFSADAMQDKNGLEAAAACIFPCYISCGCPVILHVSSGHDGSNRSVNEAEPAGSELPLVQAKRVYIHNSVGSKHDTQTSPYYTRLCEASFKCWQDHNKVVDGVLGSSRSRFISPLHERFVGVSNLDIEVLELLKLTEILGKGVGGGSTDSTVAAGTDSTCEVSSEVTLESLHPKSTT